MCGTFSWFWIWASRLYMHGGNRVMLTFPMSSALNVAFFASRIPRISRRSVRNAVMMSSFTGRGKPSDQVRVLQGGHEDPGHRVREQLGELVRRRDRDSIRCGPALKRLEDPRLPEVPGPGVRGFQKDFLKADLLGSDKGGRFA